MEFMWKDSHVAPLLGMTWRRELLLGITRGTAPLGMTWRRISTVCGHPRTGVPTERPEVRAN